MPQQHYDSNRASRTCRANQAKSMQRCYGDKARSTTHPDAVLTVARAAPSTQRGTLSCRPSHCPRHATTCQQQTLYTVPSARRSCQLEPPAMPSTPLSVPGPVVRSCKSVGSELAQTPTPCTVESILNRQNELLSTYACHALLTGRESQMKLFSMSTASVMISCIRSGCNGFFNSLHTAGLVRAHVDTCNAPP